MCRSEYDKLIDLHKRVESFKYLYYNVKKIDCSFCSDDIVSYILEKSNGDIDLYLIKSPTIIKNRIIDCIRHHTSKLEYKLKFYNMVITPMINYEFRVYDKELIEILTNRYTIKYNVCLEMKNYTMSSGRLDSRKINKAFKEFLFNNNLTQSDFMKKFEKGLIKYEEVFNDSLEYNE